MLFDVVATDHDLKTVKKGLAFQDQVYAPAILRGNDAQPEVTLKERFDRSGN